MKLKNEYLKKVLLSLSIIIFIIPVADTFLLPLSEQSVIIQSYPENHSVRRASIYICQLSNGKELNVTRSTAALLDINDTCRISYSALSKATILNFDKDGYHYAVKIGMISSSPWTLIIPGILIILAMVLLFTKQLDNYGASDFGPYVISFLCVMFFILYLTHD